MTPGRRICVVGNSGAGKTHVARKLARAHGLEYVSCDAIIFRESWQHPPPEEQRAQLLAATSGDRWSFDGNLRPDGSWRFVLERADTIVWLDLPRAEAHAQLLARTLRRCATGEKLWHGNQETFRQAFLSRDSVLWWAIKTHARRRREHAALFDSSEWQHLRRIRLRSRAAVRAWLEAHARPEGGAAPGAIHRPPGPADVRR